MTDENGLLQIMMPEALPARPSMAYSKNLHQGDKWFAEFWVLMVNESIRSIEIVYSLMPEALQATPSMAYSAISKIYISVTNDLPNFGFWWSMNRLEV